MARVAEARLYDGSAQVRGPSVKSLFTEQMLWNIFKKNTREKTFVRKSYFFCKVASKSFSLKLSKLLFSSKSPGK